MNTVRVVGIDIAKSVFQVCIWMVDGSVAWNKKISRSKLLDTIRQFEPGTLVAMEACATSHFWGRTFTSMSYCVCSSSHVRVKSDLFPGKLSKQLRNREHIQEVCLNPEKEAA
ncbi:TPA: hypothetical protein ACISZ4_004686 [Salmonella enterica subsp. enterica serovar Chester]